MKEMTLEEACKILKLKPKATLRDARNASRWLNWQCQLIIDGQKEGDPKGADAMQEQVGQAWLVIQAHSMKLILERLTKPKNTRSQREDRDREL